MNFPFDSDRFHLSVRVGSIIWRKHTLEKMLQRNISREEVMEALVQGELIQVYDYDQPFPSVLLLGFSGDRPIHVVAAFDEKEETAYVITTYEPDVTIFEADFKTKKK